MENNTRPQTPQRESPTLSDLQAKIMEWENREAAICPEDVGFEELIRALQAKIARLEAAGRTY